jgi:hypothetical protein
MATLLIEIARSHVEVISEPDDASAGPYPYIFWWVSIGDFCPTVTGY